MAKFGGFGLLKSPGDDSNGPVNKGAANGCIGELTVCLPSLISGTDPSPVINQCLDVFHIPMYQFFEGRPLENFEYNNFVSHVPVFFLDTISTSTYFRYFWSFGEHVVHWIRTFPSHINPYMNIVIMWIHIFVLIDPQHS